jgi:hypothetical protein
MDERNALPYPEGISPVNSEFSSASLSDTDIALPNQKLCQVWELEELLS